MSTSPNQGAGRPRCPLGNRGPPESSPPPPPARPPAAPEAVSGAPDSSPPRTQPKKHLFPSQSHFSLALASNSVQNAALRFRGKRAHRGEAPYPKGLSMGWARAHGAHTQPRGHTRNREPVPSCLAAGDSVAAAAASGSESEELLVASGRLGSAAAADPWDPPRELQSFTCAPAAAGGSGAQRRARCPGWAGRWCRGTSAAAVPWSAGLPGGIYPGARPQPRLRPLPEYWAIGPATRCRGSRRPLPPPSSAAAAAATWRKGAGPLLPAPPSFSPPPGKFLPGFYPTPHTPRCFAGHLGQSKPVRTARAAGGRRRRKGRWRRKSGRRGRCSSSRGPERCGAKPARRREGTARAPGRAGSHQGGRAWHRRPGALSALTGARPQSPRPRRRRPSQAP